MAATTGYEQYLRGPVQLREEQERHSLGRWQPWNGEHRLLPLLTTGGRVVDVMCQPTKSDGGRIQWIHAAPGTAL